MIDRLLSTSSHEERVSIIRLDARKRMARFLLIASIFIVITIGADIANGGVRETSISAAQLMQLCSN